MHARERKHERAKWQRACSALEDGRQRAVVLTCSNSSSYDGKLELCRDQSAASYTREVEQTNRERELARLAVVGRLDGEGHGGRR
jgi:hypothetical protein